MLSRLKHSFIGLGSTILLIALVSIPAQSDDVLDFYCDRAEAATQSQHPFEHGISFTLTAKSTLSRLERGGDMVLIDSAMLSYFVSFGEIDSIKVRESTENAPEEIDISYPNVFKDDYDFNFFPNDTGGAILSIGFDADTSNDDLPSGLAVIDRDAYFLKRLYLHYPNETRYKRRSKEIEFIKHEGFVFPSRINELFGKAGIVNVEYFRQLTTIVLIEITAR